MEGGIRRGGGGEGEGGACSQIRLEEQAGKARAYTRELNQRHRGLAKYAGSANPKQNMRAKYYTNEINFIIEIPRVVRVVHFHQWPILGAGKVRLRSLGGG